MKVNGKFNDISITKVDNGWVVRLHPEYGHGPHTTFVAPDIGALVDLIAELAMMAQEDG